MATTPIRQPPLVTEHATDRWRARASNPDAVSIWTAWTDATPVELPEPWELAGDEARYHHDTQVVLCRRDASLTTVYDLTGPDSHPIVREAVEHQLDVTLEEST